VPHRLTRIWHPAIFQDGRKRLGYFEGWYFKAVDAGGEAIAIIPGVAMPRGGTHYAFVQINRTGGRSAWFEYPFERFSSAHRHFELRIGGNRFSEEGLELDLDGEAGRVTGSLSFGPIAPWPVTLFAPGIMGPYRFAPFMECYHGVVSMDHSVDGTLVIDGEEQAVDGGRGYIEKDWGRSFPRAWIWTQCNTFERPGVSLTASVARIPWLGSSFVGFIAGLYVDGELFRFTTYSGARLVYISYTESKGEFALEDRRHRIELRVCGAVPGALRTPILGEMKGTVYESLHGEVDVRMTDRRTGAVVFEGVGRSAGLEMMDPTGYLLGR
jgi:tocopherol cyclase